MNCEEQNIVHYETFGQIGHHILIAGHLALFGDIEAAEKEMERAVILLKTTEDGI